MRTAASPVEIAAHTDPGRVRRLNEDAIRTEDSLGLAILADGMGGYNAGEVASGMAVELIHEALVASLPGLRERPLDEVVADLHEDIRFAVSRANSAIYHRASQNPDCEGMGTTLVIAVLIEDQLTVAHIGDSRLYRLRAGRLEQLTRDHSWLDEQLASGTLTAEQAENSRFKNVITRGLGIEPTVEAEIHDHAVEAGDLYLLCSDGLTDMIDDGSLEQLLNGSGNTLDATATQLVEIANDNGGRDNISVILLRPRPALSGWLGKLGGALGRK